MNRSSVVLAAFASVCLPAAASAAVTVHTSAFITTPVGSNDFEQISPSAYPVNTPYVQDGVSVTYILLGAGGPVVSAGASSDLGGGQHGWYPFGYSGYTEIKLADGSGFDQFQFLGTSGFGNGAPLQYELLYQGTSIASGVAGALTARGLGPALTYGFSGVTFDEVRLKSDPSNPLAFVADGEDALDLDNIVIGRDAAGVPEPATWAFMLIGFAAVGYRLRWRRPRFVMAGTA